MGRELALELARRSITGVVARSVLCRCVGGALYDGVRVRAPVERGCGSGNVVPQSLFKITFYDAVSAVVISSSGGWTSVTDVWTFVYVDVVRCTFVDVCLF